jgi:hypothetical protein
MQKLKIETQCAKCPWKVSTNNEEIPNYKKEKHENLGGTIWNDADSVDEIVKRLNKSDLTVMACHESCEDDPYYCVGWLHNQLGIGNNIALRFQMRNYDLRNMKVIGEQHEKFEDTK